MTDQQKSFLNIDGETLQKLLGIEIKDIKTDFQDFGYNGHVYKLEITDTKESIHPFILKKPLDTSDYNVYKDIFEPLDLQSPHIYGILNINGEDFLLTEHIPHKKVYEWTEGDYYQAIEWLIKKDTIIEKNLDKVQHLPYILPVLRDGTDEWLVNIIDGVHKSVHPLLTEDFLQRFESKKDIIRKLLGALSRTGRLTLTHNNFIPYHILFPEVEMKHELYVIDWSEPSIGTVCKDLVKFIRSAPEAYQRGLIQQYRSKIDFENFEEIFQQMEIVIDISALSWMVGNLMEGKYHMLDMHDLENRIRTIYKFMDSV